MPRKNHKNKKYSPELKNAAVQAYLAGEGSQREICIVQYIHFYNTGRYQKRLCCMTPMEFYAAA